ncbi:MAG: diguanylate cyclase [Burkholderiales bacterium]|nr:diguanylate cyclase [Burkholderiales bacterium]MDR4515898.1 diguanylate cyclase [Nitrosomonas sp.]
MPKHHSTNKLIAMGFGLIVLIFVLISIISLNEIITLQKTSKAIAQKRLPTVYLSISMENYINQTLGSLRGGMLLKEEHFKNELLKTWVKIRIAEEQMMQLSKEGNLPGKKTRLTELKDSLSQLEDIQLKILEISHMDTNLPANQLLSEKITPLTLSMTDKVMDIIDTEESATINQQHQMILVTLFKFRHTLGKALAHIRSYVLTEQIHFIHDFNQVLLDNEQQFNALVSMQNQLLPPQQQILAELTKNRKEFTLLANEVFAIRQSEDWNRANHLLRTLAIPMSQQIIELLNQMTIYQRDQLLSDNNLMAESIDNFKNKLLLLTFLAILIAMWLGIIISLKSYAIQKTIDQRAALIDQNIMIAYLDKNGYVKDISNSLCRVLNGKKADFVGKQSYYFLPAQEKDPRYATITKVIQTEELWEGEIEIVNHPNEKIWLHSKLIPTLEDSNNSGYTNILQNITDKKHLEELSITDKLTSLFNRRHFDQILEQQLKLAQRAGTSISLCVLDIDFFKSYNDFYGHQAGDHALTEVAHAIKQKLKRPNDFIFRLGGEEFGIIFSNMDTKQIEDILYQIQSDIIALNIRHERNQVHEYLTITIGCKICPNARNIQPETLYLAADTALYEAKKKRNCIIIS